MLTVVGVPARRDLLGLIAGESQIAGGPRRLRSGLCVGRRGPCNQSLSSAGAEPMILTARLFLWRPNRVWNLFRPSV